MAYGNSRSVRCDEESDLTKQPTNSDEKTRKVKYKIDNIQSNGEKFEQKKRRSFQGRVLSRVFSEDFESDKKRIFDPRGSVIGRWNKIFLVACLVSLFVDPFFFYLVVINQDICIDIEFTVEVILTIIRSITDVFYVIQIYMQFHTAYVAPSSRVFGRGELVIDSPKIASRYLKSLFWLDLAAALPLPQVLIWFVIPNLRGSVMLNTKNFLRFIIIFQYLPRLLRIFPLLSKIVETTGVITERAWTGAAYNLVLYMLASHVIGASWYLLSVESQEYCWRHVCNMEFPLCEFKHLDCHRVNNAARSAWFRVSNITTICNPSSNLYPFGIYADAATSRVTSADFFNKYLYCFWWGLKNLSSLGQNLDTSTHVGEILFAIVIAVLGLVLFGLLIGNMQTYLQSTTIRLEEWRIRRTDTEQWMHHRQLPIELRQLVRKYDQYKWVATRGVDEEALLIGLPLDLRRSIKRHLCYDLVRRVPLFDQMDERMLDAICERLKPALCTEGTCLIREGDPVDEMMFIIRGNLDSFTTNGGRTGFFNSCKIGSGDFCGEELLTWALDPRPSVVLPSSTRTVMAVSEVEAFALRSDDLKFVAGQFRRLHSKKLRHKFRFYSHQWRAWAACFIQAAWRRHLRKSMAEKLRSLEIPASENESAVCRDTETGFTATLRSSSIIIHTSIDSVSAAVASLQKPAEPYFSAVEDD